MFRKCPTYNPYRVVVDRSPNALMTGEDVFALQCGINFVNDNSVLITDGICGPKTGAAIWKVQTKLNIVSDGKAGGETQKTIALQILGAFVSREFYRLEYGQLEHESSWVLGNYSPVRPDGSYDAGISQQNTADGENSAEAFNPVQAIAKMGALTHNAYDAYRDTSKFVGQDHSETRRLKLAGGHWNAPAYANWLAGLTFDAAKPGPTALATLETYMEEIIVYV